MAPGAAFGGIGGQLLAALVAAGAIAAFLATSSGLLVSIAGALATDVLRGRVRDFRIAAVVGGLIPIPLSLMVSGLELSRSVGLAFAVAASTLCPLLVLGIWWRGLTVVGAACGLVVGGCVCGGAVLVAITGGVDDAVLGGWPAVMVGYPAAVSVPIAFLTMIIVSLFTRPTPASRRSSRACTCRSASAWVSNAYPPADRLPLSPGDRPFSATMAEFGVSTVIPLLCDPPLN